MSNDLPRQDEARTSRCFQAHAAHCSVQRNTAIEKYIIKKDIVRKYIHKEVLHRQQSLLRTSVCRTFCLPVLRRFSGCFFFRLKSSLLPQKVPLKTFLQLLSASFLFPEKAWQYGKACRSSQHCVWSEKAGLWRQVMGGKSLTACPADSGPGAYQRGRRARAAYRAEQKARA